MCSNLESNLQCKERARKKISIDEDLYENAAVARQKNRTYDMCSGKLRGQDGFQM